MIPKWLSKEELAELRARAEEAQEIGDIWPDPFEGEPYAPLADSVLALVDEVEIYRSMNLTQDLEGKNETHQEEGQEDLS